MASTDPGREGFAALDRLIVRALVSLRLARAAHGRTGSPRDLELRHRAEENLDALLDARSSARRRRSPAAPSPVSA